MKRVIAVLLVLLLGACAPEPTPVLTNETPPEKIVPLIRGGRYRLVNGDEWVKVVYSEERLISYAGELTTSEITSVSAIDYVQYWEIITTNVRGTDADIYVAVGFHFGFESTTGTGYGNIDSYSSIDTSISIDNPTDALYASESTQGILEVYSSGSCSSFRLGTIDYWQDATGFEVNSEFFSTLSYIRDDQLPAHDVAQVRCSTAEHSCKIQKGLKTDQSDTTQDVIVDCW